MLPPTLNTDEAMMNAPKLDRLGHMLIFAGHIATQFGTRLVKQRNELLAQALDDAHATAERAAYEARRAAEDAYTLGRLDEAAGVAKPEWVTAPVVVDEHQDQAPAPVVDELMCWCGAPHHGVYEHQDQAPAPAASSPTSAPTRASSPAAAAAAKVAEWGKTSEFSSLTDD